MCAFPDAPGKVDRMEAGARQPLSHAGEVGALECTAIDDLRHPAIRQRCVELVEGIESARVDDVGLREAAGLAHQLRLVGGQRAELPRQRAALSRAKRQLQPGLREP